MPAWPRRAQAWPQKFVAVKSEAGRKLISDKRVKGTLIEWKGTYGWVKPLTPIDPQTAKGRDRVYLNQNDLRDQGAVPAVGSKVDFVLYSDDQGLGAADCREVPEGVKEEFPEEEPLPLGWKRVWCEDHDEWYFWNSATKESSWTHPGAPEEEAGGDGDDGEEAPLPEGWEKVFDTERGLWYYWHRATKTSSWERPGTEEENAGEATNQEEGEGLGEEDLVLAQQRVKGKIVEWNGIAGWAEPQQELDGALHPLLKTSQERVYINWRDVEEGFKLKPGVLVEFFVAADDSGLKGVDVQPQGQAEPAAAKLGRRARARDPLVVLEKQWAAQDKELGLGGAADKAKTAAAAKDEPKLEEEAEGPLLPGWEPQWSEEHSCFYYWHKATQQSSWERPAMPLDDGEEGGGTKVWEGEGSESGAEKKATPMTPLMAQPGRAMTPITPNDPGYKGNASAASSTSLTAARAAEAARILRARGLSGGAPLPSSSAPPAAAGAGARPAGPRPAARPLPRPLGLQHSPFRPAPAAAGTFPFSRPGAGPTRPYMPHQRPQVVLPPGKRPRW